MPGTSVPGGSLFRFFIKSSQIKLKGVDHIRSFCELKKKCYICEKSKHNKEFYGSKERRYLFKYCKTCRFAHEAIKNGFVELDQIRGLSFDYEILETNDLGTVFLRSSASNIREVTLNFAVNMVKQGGASVISSNSIISITSSLTQNKALKSFVKDRDKKCFYCGCLDPDTIDHIIPSSRGGLDTLFNLTMCCESCNKFKSDITKDSFERLLKKDDILSERQRMIRRIRKSKTSECKVCSLEFTTGYNKDNHIKKDLLSDICRRCENIYAIYEKLSYKSNEINRRLENLNNLFNANKVNGKKFVYNVLIGNNVLKVNASYLKFLISKGILEQLDINTLRVYDDASLVFYLSSGTRNISGILDELKEREKLTRMNIEAKDREIKQVKKKKHKKLSVRDIRKKLSGSKSSHSVVSMAGVVYKK